MIESPLIQELEAEFTHKATLKAMHKSILAVLEARFGLVSDDVRNAVQRVEEEPALLAMTHLAARCTDLDAFGRALSADR